MASLTIPDKMLAAQLLEFKKPYTVHEIPVPKLVDPHDLLIKVAVASFCHTDLMVQNGYMDAKLPCTGSHEGAGTVVAIGSDVKGFEVGDRVMAGILYHPCEVCAECLGPEDYSQYCTQSGGYLGVTTCGFFAQYAKIDATQAVKLPDCIGFQTAAPLACAGITIYRSILLAGLRKGEWLGIVGSGGGLGHLGVQFAKALGYRVVGVEVRDEGLELTERGNADLVIDIRNGLSKAVEEVQRHTNHEGVAATINVSNAMKATAISCAITRMHGTVIQVAQPGEVVIPVHEFIFRDIRIRGSLIASPCTARQMLDIVAEHGVSAFTQSFDGFEEIKSLVTLAVRGKLKGKGIVIVDRQQIEHEKELLADKL